MLYLSKLDVASNSNRGTSVLKSADSDNDEEELRDEVPRL